MLIYRLRLNFWHWRRLHHFRLVFKSLDVEVDNFLLWLVFVVCIWSFLLQELVASVDHVLLLPRKRTGLLFELISLDLCPIRRVLKRRFLRINPFPNSFVFYHRSCLRRRLFYFLLIVVVFWPRLTWFNQLFQLIDLFLHNLGQNFAVYLLVRGCIRLCFIVWLVLALIWGESFFQVVV